MNNLTQFNVINIVILLGLAFFAIGMAIILISLLKSKNNPDKEPEIFDALDDVTPLNLPDEAEALDDDIQENNETLDVLDISEENDDVKESEEICEPDDTDALQSPEEIEEIEEVEEIDDTPKARITLAGTNNPDFIMNEFSGSITVGRRNTNDIIISDSAVSGIHCKFTFDEGKVYLTDLDSTNGTLINGQAVINSEVKTGDLIMLGQHQYRLTITY